MFRPRSMSLLALFPLALLLGACSGASGSSPSPSPNPVPSPTPPATSGAWVMGYAVGYEADLLPLADLHWADLTHIAVGRATPNPDGSLNTSFDIDPVQGPVWAKSVVQAAHAHGVKAILMLGGAGEQAGFRSAAGAAHRGTFVQNILSLVQDYGFDGVDLDWEPLEAGDEAPLKALAVDLKAGRPGLLLTLPVNFVNANDPTGEARPSFASISATFDRVNVMSYGMAGAYDGWQSWHSSALTGDTENTPSSVDSSVKAYLAAGVPAGKLGVGIGFYGLCWKGVKEPRQTAAGMQVVADDGDMSYANIAAQYLAPAAKRWDAAAQVPYLSSAAPLGPKGCTFVSYEDAQSIAAKGQYARGKGLGGVVIWTLAQGHTGGGDPLLDATKAAFRP